MWIPVQAKGTMAMTLRRAWAWRAGSDVQDKEEDANHREGQTAWAMLASFLS